MKAGLTNPWAFAPSNQRREPTSDEIANGFPCGPADQQLFNELMYRMSLMTKEIATVITGEGITPDETKFNQLQLAMTKTIQRFGGIKVLNVSNTGNDANDGLTSGTALATINEAIARASGYKTLIIELLSDLTVTTAPPASNSMAVVIISRTVPRNLTLAPGCWTIDFDGVRRSFRFNGAFDFLLERVNVINNVVEPTVPGLWIGSGGFVSLSLCSYSVVSSSARPLLQSFNLTGVNLSAVTFTNSDAAGKFLLGVAAGGDPNNTWPWRSNDTSL